MNLFLNSTESPRDLSANQNQSASINRYEISKSSLLVYSASELLATFNGKETDFLWDNLIPRVGTGLLVGQPDLGKSQLAKELAIMIAKGSSEYLGLKLKPIHNHVLYIFTEDQEEGVSSSLHKQLVKHSDLDKSKLSLAFLRDETITELILKIDQFCIETPVDLVVIDAFGDIFSGTDSNNNIQMRRDIKAFDDVVRKHSLSILFVHHVNKSGYNKNPSQELIQGGSGLTQKVRFALFLSRNDEGQKFLNVAKGNYLY
jgi:RecA-family ATPase